MGFFFFKTHTILNKLFEEYNAEKPKKKEEKNNYNNLYK